MPRFFGRATGRTIVGGLAVFAAFAFAAPASGQAGHALGFDTTNFDRSIRPQDDFFRYVNGSWLTRTGIPADASSWGAFNELRERSRDALHTILEEAAKSNAKPGTEERKVGDLYASFMDTARVETLGIGPLAAEMRTI